MVGRTLLLIFKKSFLLILAGAVLATAVISNLAVSVLAKKAYYPLAGKTIVVDPGHGGVDSGANDAGFKEKNVNLEVALKLREILTLAGAKVIMTRIDDGDVTHRGDPSKKRYHRDMDGRKNIMNGSGADIFISLHVNSCRDAYRTRGAFVFYHKTSEQGKVLAECLQGQLNALVANYKKEGEHASRDPHTADYYLLRNAAVPAALIELGFMTHHEERKLLLDPGYQKKLAQAITDGLRDYFLCQAIDTNA